MLPFGPIFGTWKWLALSASGPAATTGTVMPAALPVILGVVLVLNLLSIDVMMVPREPLYPKPGKAFGRPSPRRRCTRY